MDNKVWLIVSICLAVTVLGGCLEANESPPTRIHTIDENPTPKAASASFTAPLTGDVFSTVGYVSTTANDLHYKIPRLDNRKIDRIYVETIPTSGSDTSETGYDGKSTIYEGYAIVTLEFPLDEDCTTNQYRIIAENETRGVIDGINATVERVQ
ncbi:hypothetical protein [Halorhabdus rudnickae]|uniref:hypothetical protein n=1 Tax=Halorhabdus rudnickae TaxID=1775544 RepID=UPI0010835F3F|nr:hypothetical protein [Halorhabdus rudnickae]